MTPTSQKAESRWGELSDDVLESVRVGRKAATEAVSKFVDEVSPVLTDQSGRKTVVDAALKLADELATTRAEFVRSVARSVGHALAKEPQSE